MFFEEVEWVVGNSESKIIVVGHNPGDNDEKEKMPNHRLNACIENLQKVERIVALEGVEKLENSKFISWHDFLTMGSKISDSEVLKGQKSLNQIILHPSYTLLVPREIQKALN